MNKNPNNPDFGESGFDSTDETLNNTTRINMPDEYSESNNPTQNYNPNFNSDFERNFNQNPVQNNNYQNYSDGSQNYNPNYNGCFNPNYNPNYNPNPYDRNNMYRRKSNTGLIVAISVMSVLAAVIIITIILFATNVISPGKSHNEQDVSTEAQVPAQQENTPPAQQPQTQPQKPAEQSVSVERTMFVGNCNISVTLRTGPAASYPEITQVPLASEIYVIEYTNSDFALVTYNGSRGYIKRNYIVSTRPQVYDYNASAVQNFVHDSILCFVNGVNTGNYDYVSAYFSGSAADQELKSVKSIHDSVSSEEIISLNCHSATRASATQVTVIRDSVIRVTYPDGTVKDVSERYKYTVDISGSTYKIIGLKEA